MYSHFKDFFEPLSWGDGLLNFGWMFLNPLSGGPNFLEILSADGHKFQNSENVKNSKRVL